MEEGWVEGSGWISDESEFHGQIRLTDHASSRIDGVAGNREVRADLEDRVRFRDVSSDWKCHASSPATVAMRASPTTPATEDTDKAQLYFPFDGSISHRQSTETVDDFVRRLRPSTVKTLDVGDWIWIRNPFIPPRTDRKQDEEALRVLGQQLLDDYLDIKQKTTLKMSGNVRASLTPRLGPQRTKLEQELKQTAINANYLSGKWLLFPLLAEVDRVWQSVAEGVSKGQLGPKAKVATASNKSGDGARVICIYTEDFSDQKDVKRVLDALGELDLIDAYSAQGISYKSDAYTVLGIDYGNGYDIKPSQYRSKELLRGKTVQKAASIKKSRTGFTF